MEVRVGSVVKRYAVVLVFLILMGCQGNNTPRDTGSNGQDDDPVTIPMNLSPLRVMAPRMPASGEWQRMGIFWFGQITRRENHHQVRIAHDDNRLRLMAIVFDREIYDEATDDALEQWDSIRVLLDLDGDPDKSTIDARSFRFDVQALRHGTDRMAIYRGNNGQWERFSLQVGDNPNDLAGVNITRGYRGMEQDQSKGWHIFYYLPWQALGLTGPPPDARLRLGMIGFDRDSADGSLQGQPQGWPLATINQTNPKDWGDVLLIDGEQLSLDQSGSTEGAGKPAFSIVHNPEPFVTGTERNIVIRNGLNGVTVEEACLGASEILCNGDDDYNFGYGTNSWGGNVSNEFFHVQNQNDYSDFPCFAKLIFKFPLHPLPPNTVVVGAEFVLHHAFPTSGGSEGYWSLMHVFSAPNVLLDGLTPWTANNISWNTAPLPIENLASTWVDRTGFNELGWNNLPELTWDVSSAVSARAGEEYISFFVYSTDTEYHTGKSFVRSTDFPDWGDPSQRPTLRVTVADPRL